MDPVTAFGLLVNVATLIDLGVKVISIYKDGLGPNQTRLVESADEMEGLCQQLKSTKIISQPTASGSIEAELQDCVKRCIEKATALQKRLDLRLASRRQRALRSVRMQFSRKIPQLERDLQELRGELDTKLLVSIRENINLNALKQTERFKSLELSVQTALVRFCHSQSTALDLVLDRNTRQILDRINEVQKTHIENEAKKDIQQRRSRILESLLYGSPFTRENDIESKHDGTFEWIFDEGAATGSAFLSWLRSSADGCIFWIQTADTLLRDHSVCIFVDALDECLVEDQVKVLRLVKQLSSRGVKICLSSRPEQGLVNKLAPGATEILKVDLYTKDDIERFINDEFDAVDLSPGTISPSGLSFLASEITKQAEGVFLWATLVAKDVRKGVENGDDFDQLRSRVDQTPDIDLDRAVVQAFLDSGADLQATTLWHAPITDRFVTIDSEWGIQYTFPDQNINLDLILLANARYVAEALLRSSLQPMSATELPAPYCKVLGFISMPPSEVGDLCNDYIQYSGEYSRPNNEPLLYFVDEGLLPNADHSLVAPGAHTAMPKPSLSRVLCAIQHSLPQGPCLNYELLVDEFAEYIKHAKSTRMLAWALDNGYLTRETDPAAVFPDFEKFRGQDGYIDIDALFAG
ncbi:hypothetical protein BDW74DRAFT_174102 [Aspergillus multicolor]|uniref:uncharacterized protein n=1 Tax=Aspergillus multicolor TaxID=41759 RepID=UPI003CCDF612